MAMGISLSVLKVIDDHIRRFDESPKLLEALLVETIAHGSSSRCYLADYWDGLDFLLTEGQDKPELPLCALKRGDVAYVDTSDPTHAIFSTTTHALARVLSLLDESTLRARFNPQRMLNEGGDGRTVYPGRLWVFPNLAEATFRELMFYFSRLRDFTAQASEENKGLLFHRYEDW